MKCIWWYLDTEALARGMGRRPEELRPQLTAHAPLDVTGSLNRLKAYVKTAPAAADLDGLIQTPAAVVSGQLPGPFDLVLSDCLLGQIMHSCRKAMGDSPHLGVVAQAAAMGHLNLLGRLCRPGGTVLLVTDTVSSETYPLEELWGEQPPLELLTYLEKTDNTFSGTGPSYVRRLLNREPLRPQFERRAPGRALAVAARGQGDPAGLRPGAGKSGGNEKAGVACAAPASIKLQADRFSDPHRAGHVRGHRVTPIALQMSAMALLMVPPPLH